MEYGERGLKDILYQIDSLIKLGYGSYQEVCDLTLREITDISIVQKSLQQEREVRNSAG